MVRDVCSDAGFRVARNAPKHVVTRLVFPLSSLRLGSTSRAGERLTARMRNRPPSISTGGSSTSSRH